MFYKASFISVILLQLVLTGEASMNGQTVNGEILDRRIAQCGVHIDGSEIAMMRPFIKTSEPLAGEFHIIITKQSSSGTSMSNQSGRFTDGSLGETVLAVERPSTVLINMQVNATGGKILCRMNAQVNLEPPMTRL